MIGSEAARRSDAYLVLFRVSGFMVERVLVRSVESFLLQGLHNPP